MYLSRARRDSPKKAIFLSHIKHHVTPERPEPGHYRKASAEPWARKQVISSFLAQGSADAFL